MNRNRQNCEYAVCLYIRDYEGVYDMISCKLAGGLGNYMFQIGAAASLAKEVDTTFVVDNRDIMQAHNNVSLYTNNWFRKITFGIPTVEYIWEEGPQFEYDKLPLQNNLKLVGHFQSHKYLNREVIVSLYNIDDLIAEMCNNSETISSTLQKITQSDSVSIHVRRGDYLNLPLHHPTCTIEYYQSAIETVGTAKEYFVFSDDYEWCVRHFHTATVVHGFADWVDLYFMSKCKNNIIANSSFSWWGAWLNNNQDKRIIAPSVWFGPAKEFNTKDLLPMEWIRI
jgi:hypothetical protein